MLATTTVVNVPVLGPPALLDPVSDAALHLICCGLLIPSQATAKTMAVELRKWRGDPHPERI